MYLRKYILLLGLLFSASNITFAQRELSRPEILSILQSLTSKPRKTWLTYGKIEALHEEFKAPKITDPNVIAAKINQARQEYLDKPSVTERTDKLRLMKYNAIPFNIFYKYANEYTMVSYVTVRYDGTRFYWGIDVISRDDAIKPTDKSSMNEYFNVKWNSRRVFTWDGYKYTTYFRSGNQATVQDSMANVPVAVNGPLTAGIIPWGYGIYSYDNLIKANMTACETIELNQVKIVLNLAYPDGSNMYFRLDPAKGYAVEIYALDGPDNFSTWQTYGNYQFIAEQWIPSTITISRYYANNASLPAVQDTWNFTSIQANLLDLDNFSADFANDTLIEYYSPIQQKPLMYRYSHKQLAGNGIDTDALLMDKLRAILAREQQQPQNGATLALKYMAKQLNKPVSDEALMQIIDEPGNGTSLYALREYARHLGFYILAVRTDINTLMALPNCQILLHLPGKKHYVVLGNIDDKYVRLIDLTGNDFYYRIEIAKFTQVWNEGTALIIANEPIQLPGMYSAIDEDQLIQIIGREEPGYGGCTKLLQSYNVAFCPYPVGSFCDGSYTEYFELYGCESAPENYQQSGGASACAEDCQETCMLKAKESPCFNDPFNPGSCAITGEWICYYMQACSSSGGGPN